MDVAPGKEQKIRAFIAIHADRDTLGHLQAFQQTLQTELKKGVRWAKPEQLHLTLQFLGYVPATQIDEYKKAIEQVAQRNGAFQLRAEGLGCFPTIKRPRVIWAGLVGEVEALQGIKSQLDTVLTPLGYVPEERPFHPHITFGRVDELNRTDATALQKRIADWEGKKFGEWTVQSIDLMQSVLSSKGPTYHLLTAAALRSA